MLGGNPAGSIDSSPEKFSSLRCSQPTYLARSHFKLSLIWRNLSTIGQTDLEAAYDGSFDSPDDPDTGTASSCGSAGGNWFDGSPSDWGLNDDWSNQANANFANQWLNQQANYTFQTQANAPMPTDSEIWYGDAQVTATIEPRAANNGNLSCNSITGICVPSTMMKPRPAGCGAAIAQGAISFGLDVVGAIPGFGNAVSATAAGARAVNGIVAYGGAAYGIATGLPDESPVGAAGAGAGLGLTLADAALEGGKVIPVLGNALSATIGLYDGYQLAKTIGKCW
jgi:hypothetical protein